VKAVDALDRQGAQAELAELIGVSEARVSQLVSDGVVERGQTLAHQLRQYCAWLREVAAGRQSEELGGLDLVQERAALAREQRHGIEIKNAVARGEFAPIGLLAEVLATASMSVVERFDQLPAALRKTCPDLPEAARDQVMSLLANARNEWVRATADLVAKSMAPADDVDDDLIGDDE
jgi:phage terminase Nu1 subunit (DNA packaging protein)